MSALAGGMVLLWRWKREQQQLPPAPPGWRPVLGHLPLLGALPHQALAELARRHAPDLMSLRLGSVLVIVASTPHAAQLLLQTFDQAFTGRPQSAVSTHLAFNSSNITLSPPDAQWRRMRHICVTHLLSNKRIRSLQSIRCKGVRTLLSAAYAQRGQVMELRPKLLASSLDIIANMTIGRPVSEVSPLAAGLIRELLHLSGAFNMGDFIPWLAWLDLQGYERRIKLVGQRWSSLLQEFIDLRRSAAMMDRQQPGTEYSESPSMDLLDALLSESELTDDNIKGVIGDMFIGGMESTSITIEWALAELMANPTVMGILQQELEKVVGKRRLVQEEDLDSLPYLHAVVKEVMRLHPAGPFLVPHEATQACKVYGYSIQPKTRVLVNVWAIGGTQMYGTIPYNSNQRGSCQRESTIM